MNNVHGSVLSNVVIETHKLSKVYGKQKAVDNLNLTVREGEIYGFLGQNGAGKTTTIRMLLGLVKPTAGVAKMFGETITPGTRKIFEKVGTGGTPELLL
jgi:bacitracin transport system ATP-binding protein